MDAQTIVSFIDLMDGHQIRQPLLLVIIVSVTFLLYAKDVCHTQLCYKY